jgi:hypothetical protein
VQNVKQAWLAAIFLFLPAAARADDRAQENDVLVHLDGSAAASLERLDGSEWVWECKAPCDLRLPRSDRYRIVGKGIHESDPFELIASPGSDETIHVRASSKARSTAGAIVFLSGLVGAVSGLIMFEVANANNDCDRDVTAFGDPGPPCHSYDGLRYTGIGVAIGGLINLAVGALLYSAHLSSTLTQSSGVDQPSRVEIFPRRSIASKSDACAHALPGVPVVSDSPVFSFSF